MNQQELRTALSLATVFAVRMLGLFMILPVLPLYTQSLENITPFLIGLAIGIYGFTQAIFQIPLGLLSDKIGRKPVILLGLIVFAIGSVIAALSENIQWIIAGRAIQGMGAIAAATMALAADLTREDIRARVMAIIGMSIGIAFALAMVMGPLINEFIGIQGIFWVTSLLAALGILLTLFIVPTPLKTVTHKDAGIISDYLKPVFSNLVLLRMNTGVFILHLLMTSSFVVIPLIFSQQLGLENTGHWKIYLPVLLVSVVFALPMIIVAEKYRKIKGLFLMAITMIILAEIALGFSQLSRTVVYATLLVFFIGFNFLEAVQPSLVSKYASLNTKGTAMGVYATFQFMGIFAGGVLGGYLMEHYTISTVFIINALIAFVYLLIAASLPRPEFYRSRLISLKPDYFKDIEKTTRILLGIEGIKEVAIAPEEMAAYIKIDKKLFNENSLAALKA